MDGIRWSKKGELKTYFVDFGWFSVANLLHFVSAFSVMMVALDVCITFKLHSYGAQKGDHLLGLAHTWR